MDAFGRLRWLLAVLFLALVPSARGQPQVIQLQQAAPQADIPYQSAYSGPNPYGPPQLNNPSPSPYLIGPGTSLHVYQGHQGAVHAVAFSPNGKFLASAGLDNTIRVWGLASGSELRQLVGHQGYVQSVAFAPDGKTLASGGFDKTCRLWDLAAGQELVRFTGHLREVHGVAFSPNGKTLASAGADATVRLWEIGTGKERLQALGHQGEVHAGAFSPDGKTFASAGQDRSVRLWETATGKEVRRLEGHLDAVVALAFSPDGKVLASGSQDQAVRLWDVATGQELRRLTGHQGAVRSVAFSPDGRTLASAGQDQVVRLWELATGQECRQFRGHFGVVWSVAFSPDGRSLASASEDRTVRVWDVTGLLQGNELRPSALSAKEMDDLWADLASLDSARAFRARWVLAGAGNRAVSFVGEHLPRGDAESPADPRRIARLIADLDNDQAAVRERATDELEKLGRAAEPALRQALAGRPSAEVQLRAQLLLDGLRTPALVPDVLRALRAVEVLERIGTPEARRVLETLARGVPEARLTQEAKASLERLEGQVKDAPAEGAAHG